MLEQILCREQFSKCSISVKLTLFQSYCANAYCSHLWANYTKATFNKLKVAYNNVHRRLLGCTRRDSACMMLVTNGIDIETLYRKYIYKFMKCVEYSSNVIIHSMYGNYLVRGGPCTVHGRNVFTHTCTCAHYIKNGAIVIIIDVCF